MVLGTARRPLAAFTAVASLAAAFALVSRGAAVADPSDTTPPGPVTDLYASGSITGQTYVSWSNPKDPDWSETIVTYAAGHRAPASPDGGTLLYDGRDGQSDTSLPRIAKGYSFSAFAVDTSGNVSSRATHYLPAFATITLRGRPELLVAGHWVTLTGRMTVAGTHVPMPHHPMRFRTHHVWQQRWHVRTRFRTHADGTFRVRLRLWHTTFFLLDDSFTDHADSGKGPIRIQVTHHRRHH
jgi:hypothetical protein